ncbi:MAG: hypothetical protein GY778_02110 [bacterium]|nr:hypothetical protein [bacterium]
MFKLILNASLLVGGAIAITLTNAGLQQDGAPSAVDKGPCAATCTESSAKTVLAGGGVKSTVSKRFRCDEDGNCVPCDPEDCPPDCVPCPPEKCPPGCAALMKNVKQGSGKFTTVSAKATCGTKASAKACAPRCGG